MGKTQTGVLHSAFEKLPSFVLLLGTFEQPIRCHNQSFLVLIKTHTHPHPQNSTAKRDFPNGTALTKVFFANSQLFNLFAHRTSLWDK